MKAVVLLSGGLDSAVALAKAIEEFGHHEVMGLSLYYGQKHDKELESARNLANYYQIILKEADITFAFEGSDCSLLSGSEKDIPEGSYKEMSMDSEVLSTYVPYRNGLFLSVAASIALSKGATYLYYGIHCDDGIAAYPDTSAEFQEAISKSIYIGSGKALIVRAPFVNLHKEDVVKEGIRLHVPFELTWSCYNGREKACGKCGTCVDRLAAFKANGIVDPIPYEEENQ